MRSLKTSTDSTSNQTKMTSRLSALKFYKKLLSVPQLILFIIAILVNYAAAAEKNPFILPVPEFSISHSGNECASLINPVFSDEGDTSSIIYRYMQYQGEPDGNHMGIMNISGFNFSYIWLDNLYDEKANEVVSADTKFFNIGKGFLFSNTFGLGVNYSFTKSRFAQYNDYKSFTLGALFRPAGFMSIAYVARDINNPELENRELSRRDIYSLSIRPLGHYLTLSVDLEKLQGEKFKDSNYIFSTDINIFNGISILGSIDKDKNISAGLTMPFDMSHRKGSSMILDYYGFKGEKGNRFSQAGITFSDLRYRSPFNASRRLLVINLEQEVEKIEADSFFSGREIRFYHYLSAIQNAASDDSICGIVLIIDQNNLGFAQIQELRDQLKYFRKQNKKIFSIMKNSGNKDYYLASVSDKIIFMPNTLFTLSGLKAEVYFIKNALDKIGIKFETIRKGKYKALNEPFTNEHMSKEYRENLTSLLSDLNEQFLKDITADRKLKPADVDGLINGKGMLTPSDAKGTGFIDSIEYPDKALKEIKKIYGINCLDIKMPDYIYEKKKNYTWGPISKIAVIYVSGAIVQGQSSNNGILIPSVTGDEDYKKLLGRTFFDSSIKAIVLRINTGGGSAVASDLMLHYLKEHKNKYRKPVVFSFGNIAASGGYYIACSGDKIFVSPGTITGSIGVISGKPSLSELFKKLGINRDIIKMSQYADIYSIARDFNEKEREILTKAIEFIYQRFTGKVTKARGIDKEKIPEIAEGRVFTGKQASGNKLADEIGGLVSAIEQARKLAEIDNAFIVDHFPRSSPSLTKMLLERNLNKALYKKIEPMFDQLGLNIISDEPFLYLYPYKIEIK